MNVRLFACLTLLCLACGRAGQPADVGQAQQPPAPISDESASWLLKEARLHFQPRSSTAGDGQVSPPQVRESRPTMLFVTGFVGGRAASAPAVGQGENLAAALRAALDRLPDGRSRASVDRIRIDVLDGPPTPFDKPSHTASGDSRPAMSALDLIDVGMEGIAIETRQGAFYHLPADMIYGSIIAEEPDEQTAENLLDGAAIRAGLGKGAWQSPDVRLSRFRTVSFVESATHTEALRLTRGFTLIDQIDRPQLMSAARSGGDYLVGMQRPEGSFTYLYQPLQNRASRTYNIVRHAGTAFSLFDLYAATTDARYLEAANRAVDFLETRFRPVQQHDAYYVLDDDGRAKLGANGLALLALTRQAELDPSSAKPDSAHRLAKMIMAMQNADGSFESYYRLRGDEPAGSVSLYYPGEAILGLVSLFEISGQNELLESARRGADNVIQSQRSAAELPPDAWLMQALEELYKLGPEQRYFEHTMALGASMLAHQYLDDAPSGYAGGFGPGIPRTTPAAARSEGLLAAYRLAASLGDGRASAIKAALDRSARFQLSQQFNPDNSFFVPDPARARGGFRGGPTSMDIRIDFVQHNISSFLGIANIH